MNIIPLDNRLVVSPIEDENISAGGVVIPDTAAEKPQKGLVTHVGIGALYKDKRIPMQVSVGDIIIYSKYGGTDVEIEGELVKVLRETDVIGIMI